MRTLLIVFVFGLMILTLTNCEKDNVDLNNLSIDQRIFFQYEYINHAWGDQHSGWLIDSSGNVYCYNNPDNWYFSDTLGMIGEDSLNSNILATDSICFVLDKKDLINKIILIDDASKGEISEPMHEMCDAGITVYAGYTFNQDKKTYKKVILKQIGDFTLDNSSQASVDLYMWLDSINFKIHNPD